jgi:single-strand DNA-binding protein
MPYLNRVTLMGHLGRDVDVKESQAGKHWAQLSISTQRKFGNDGEKKTDWHDVVAFGWTAKGCSGWKKGQVVYVEGVLTNNKWEKDGVVNKTSRIVAEVAVRVDTSKPKQEQEEEYEDAPF